MSKSTEDLLRELEAGGVTGNAPAVTRGTRAPNRQSPSERGTSNVVLLVVAAVLFAVIGSIPFGADILYPFSLFVTLVHESCHAIVGSLTGGDVLSLRVRQDLSGVTSIRGGTQLLFSPAGYLGASAVGAALLATPPRYARWALGTLAIIPALALILFHPASIFTAFWCVFYITGLGAAVWKLRGRALEFLQVLLGVACSLNAFRDLMTLFFISSSNAHIQTDAANMSRLIPLPATVWAVLWTIVSLVILIGAVYTVIRRDLHAHASHA
jgi:hypothetical protein